MAVQSFLAKMCESHITLAAEQHGNRRAETGVLFRSHCGWFPREVHRYLNSKAPSMQTVRKFCKVTVSVCTFSISGLCCLP